ncbi:MAG: hypothetical protein R2736_18680 [Solirubrobacterales bacterium]
MLGGTTIEGLRVRFRRAGRAAAITADTGGEGGDDPPRRRRAARLGEPALVDRERVASARWTRCSTTRCRRERRQPHRARRRLRADWSTTRPTWSASTAATSTSTS